LNVLVLTNMAPFIRGGAEELTEHLVINLRRHGVNAEAMRIPYTWDPAERLLDEIVICRSLRLWNADRVIALKFPAYHVPHDNKVLWLLHQHRQAYDLWDAGKSNIPNDDRGHEIRRLIRNADNETFASAKHVYTISKVTADRARRYNGIEAEVLMYPLNHPELFTPGDYGDYILAAGRVNSGKRQWLLVEAMRHVPRGIKLIVAGPPETESDAIDLKKRVAAAGLEDRVILDLRFLPRDELARLVSNARAVAYAPYDEDSVGYVTAEACNAAKAVITTTDSGGLLQLVIPGETGCVGAPDPESIAAAIAPLVDGTAEAMRLGRQARAHWQSLNITWPATVERLLS
jgi:glycosyltransferase involved in cell wall biosynthesis